MRTAQVERKTNESQIKIGVNLDGTGLSRIKTPIGFFTHMLETFAKHSLIDIEAEIKGDTHVDQHHLVEDTGIVLGDVIKQALGDKKGIQRAGFFLFPMDEALSQVAIDICDRPYSVCKIKLRRKKIGDFEGELIVDFFQGFATALGATIHTYIISGRSDHHKVESVFKALAKALKQACMLQARAHDQLPSTKGKI
jgi:imidazoleglycerol-phosphate dehydratase